MVDIDKKIADIRGIGKAIIDKLQEHSVNTVEDLHQKTLTPANRDLFSKETGINRHSLYIWAKQADLMRIFGIDAVSSELLVKCGIRNTGDLAIADTNVLKQLIDVTLTNDSINYERTVLLSDLETWKADAAGIHNMFVCDDTDLPLVLLFSADPVGIFETPVKKTLSSAALLLQDNARKNLILQEARFAGEFGKMLEYVPPVLPQATESGFFFGLSELMTEIARGVAQAQHELDKSSLAMQNFIDADESLSNYGLSATWFAMPETSFSLKVDYTAVKEETSKGDLKPIKTLRVAPVNATYQNYFTSTSNIESAMNFKIVPVPPPVSFTEPVLVPDLQDLSLEEAQKSIRDSGLIVGLLELLPGMPDNGKASQVIAQSKDPGTEVRVNEVISVAYYKKEV